MASIRLLRPMFIRLLVLDLVMTPTATITWMVFLDVRDMGGVVTLCALMYVVRVLIWGAQLARALRPAQVWLDEGTRASESQLLMADEALGRAPVQISLGYVFAGVAYFIGIVALVWFAFPEFIALGRNELVAMTFLCGSLAIGPPVVILPLFMMMLDRYRVGLSATLSERELEQERVESPIAPRLFGLSIGLVISAICWLSATAWIAQGQAARSLAEERLAESVRWSAYALDNAEGGLVEGQELVATADLPPSLGHVDPGILGQVERSFDERNEVITAAAALGDGRWVIAHNTVDIDRGSFWISLLGVTFAVLLGSAIAMGGTARSLAGPLAQLRQTLRRVVEIGDLREIERVPVVAKDEVGTLIYDFNHMLDMFEELAAASLVIAEGDLRVDLEGRGDLHDAFRLMVARLTELVSQIRHATIDVSSAAAEIGAAVAQQEGAAQHQSEGIREVYTAMQQLEDSATEITAAAEGVLLNAKQSRSQADVVGVKIDELGAQIVRVGELLGLIREIADRSDLLALNGSLEATRAGEAGRGFELVAKEMRRLAERVGSTVSDVRDTVATIEIAKGETEQVTSSSRALADNTTTAAQQIVDNTGSQSVQTELVATNLQGIVELVTASVSATSQTRAVADNLRLRADQLRKLIDAFEVDEAVHKSV